MQATEKHVEWRVDITCIDQESQVMLSLLILHLTASYKPSIIVTPFPQTNCLIRFTVSQINCLIRFTMLPDKLCQLYFPRDLTIDCPALPFCSARDVPHYTCAKTPIEYAGCLSVFMVCEKSALDIRTPAAPHCTALQAFSRVIGPGGHSRADRLVLFTPAGLHLHTFSVVSRKTIVDVPGSRFSESLPDPSEIFRPTDSLGRAGPAWGSHGSDRVPLSITEL
ncbi:hypothetical protein BaRGS_00017112 [Batillaria attramentaria]|uniref:Uncharacterized protein n=1 Tax=Batillaria attramentaria TaxID=370345 RepID=A0ABD0KWY6_9CAEN